MATSGFNKVSHYGEPADAALAITPSDSTDLVMPTGAGMGFPRGLYVGGAGHVSVIMESDSGAATPVLFSNATAGSILPIRVRRVRSTGTTATLLIGLY